MESELASYAAQQMIDAFRDDNVNSDFQSTLLLPEENRFIADANSSIVSIEERIASFDDIAAKETFVYVRDGILELPSPLFCRCGDEGTLSSDGSRCSISSSSSGVGSHPAFMLGNDDDDSNKNVDESLSDDGDTLYDDGKELEGPHLLAGEMHSMEPTIRSPIAVIESSILQADHPSERTHLI